MGIYVLEPEATDFIPDGYMDIPDLIAELHKANKKVTGYLHEGYWLDIGRLEDYQAACQALNDNKVDFGVP